MRALGSPMKSVMAPRMLQNRAKLAHHAKKNCRISSKMPKRKGFFEILQRQRAPHSPTMAPSGPEQKDVNNGGLRAPATNRGTKTGQTDRQTDRQTNPTGPPTQPPKKIKGDCGSLAHGVFAPYGVSCAPVVCLC